VRGGLERELGPAFSVVPLVCRACRKSHVVVRSGGVGTYWCGNIMREVCEGDVLSVSMTPAHLIYKPPGVVRRSRYHYQGLEGVF